MKNSGFIALITIFLINLISVFAILEIIFFATTEFKEETRRLQSFQAGFLADSCAEEALIKLKENPEYQGDEIVENKEGFCKILPIKENIIKTEGHFKGCIRKVKVEIQSFFPKIKIKSWKEVADF